MVSNIYQKIANFSIESLKSTFVLTMRHIHIPEVQKLWVNKTGGILYESFILVNIISLETNLN